MICLAPTCHQLPERSYYLGKWQMPVCARCQGLYIGYLIGLFFYIPIVSLLVPLTYIDGLIQLKTAYQSNNRWRLISGILSGIAMIQLLKLIFFLITA